MTNEKYLKELEGFNTSFYDVKAAVEDITPGSFEKLNYTSRVLAENLLRKCPSEDLEASLIQLIEKRTDKSRNPAIMLFTDGMPNVSPPRGEIEALKIIKK